MGLRPSKAYDPLLLPQQEATGADFISSSRPASSRSLVWAGFSLAFPLSCSHSSSAPGWLSICSVLTWIERWERKAGTVLFPLCHRITFRERLCGYQEAEWAEQRTLLQWLLQGEGCWYGTVFSHFKIRGIIYHNIKKWGALPMGTFSLFREKLFHLWAAWMVEMKN